jgi:hypothetical protein
LGRKRPPQLTRRLTRPSVAPSIATCHGLPCLPISSNATRLNSLMCLACGPGLQIPGTGCAVSPSPALRPKRRALETTTTRTRSLHKRPRSELLDSKRGLMSDYQGSSRACSIEPHRACSGRLLTQEDVERYIRCLLGHLATPQPSNLPIHGGTVGDRELRNVAPSTSRDCSINGDDRTAARNRFRR